MKHSLTKSLIKCMHDDCSIVNQCQIIDYCGNAFDGKTGAAGFDIGILALPCAFDCCGIGPASKPGGFGTGSGDFPLQRTF